MPGSPTPIALASFVILSLSLISGLHLVAAMCPPLVSPFMSTTCDQSDVPVIGGVRDIRTLFCRAVIDMTVCRSIVDASCEMGVRTSVIVVITDFCLVGCPQSVDHC